MIMPRYRRYLWLPFSLLAAWASFAGGQLADQSDLPGARPGVASVRDWIAKGEGKLTEADVLARLGPADRVEIPLDPNAKARAPEEITMVWEEASWIGIIFWGPRARRVEGHFSAHVDTRTITLDHLRRLRPGMTRKAIEQMLGAPSEDRDMLKEFRRCDWVKGVELAAHFRYGKLVGHHWIVKQSLPAPNAPIHTKTPNVSADSLKRPPPATWAPAATAEEERRSGSRPGMRPALSKELRLWLEEGRNRLSEAEVFRKMGVPDFIFNPADPDVPGEAVDELGMIWRDQARIDIDIKAGKVWMLRGQFSPNVRSEVLTMENFRKLEPAMTELRVEEILGRAEEEPQPVRDIRRQVWRTRQEIVVYFRAGKVKSLSWWGPF
jgi:hypothetical protein